MTPRIEELLAKLPDLSESEVEELRNLILEAAAEHEDKPVTASSALTLNRLAEAADKVVAFEARGKIGALTAAGGQGGTVARMAARRRRPQRSPEAGDADSAGRAVLTAAGGLDGMQEGATIDDRYDLAEAMSRTLERLDRRGPSRGRVLCASAAWTYPEERQLTDDASLNARRLDAVCHPNALVATGGICLPVNVDYAVPTWATADRPVRDGLAAFAASRGGIRFVKPLDISDWAAATGIWTEATDAEPAAATKPVVSMSCGTEELVYVEAIPTRMGFGNMQSRFAPEQVAANTDLAMAAAARIAENNLLELIAAQCVKDITSATVIGATRDLLTAVGQVVAGYRQLHRIPRTQMITAIFPDWLRELLRVDMAREIGHSQNGDWNALGVLDDQLDELLQVRGINPIWHLDGQNAEVSGGVAQTFAAPEAAKAVKAFPTKMVWYAFVEGSIQFLDGGRLDLGVVRDSTLDATNDYETFVEPFESIANRGFTGSALQLVTSLCADGSTAGTRSTEGHCA